MTAKMVMVCEACQGNNHTRCANEQACVCALRGHPEIERLQMQANIAYRPNPGQA